MNGYRIGRLHRVLRHRAGLTQEELARKCSVGRWKIVKLEAGELADLRLGDVDRCFAALDARLDVRGWYHGAAADRLLDEGHAGLAAQAVDVLRPYGWVSQVEVSFSEFGERGSVDVLGWHATTGTLFVEEIKSEMGSIEGTLRPLDVKCRLAPKIALKRFGWSAKALGRILLLPEDRTARRAVDRHAAVLDVALPARSRELRSWVRQPRGGIAGIWFLTDVGGANGRRNPSAIRRVRRARPRSHDGS
ncbi:MAG TPA: helix-turn-helix transcriptional regulator [Candidatus Caenarcaniphilales bacterium]|nr:helix-turn-helix transcriptional regulator [Candidatus Caenarcaniphilales bacterium]